MTPTSLDVALMRLDEALPAPAYAHDGDAGLDLYSTVSVTIDPGQRVLIPTGVAVALPAGHAGLVMPRSGRALRDGMSLVNTPGLIDSHYRGEIKVIAINHDASTAIQIVRGEKIAQLVIQRVEHAVLREVPSLDPTTRGEDGFGSTGA